MKCPRCQTGITATPDSAGFLTCPGCGARLRSRSAVAAAARTAGASPSHPSTSTSTEDLEGILGRLDPEGPRFPDGTNPNATLPPGTPLPRIPRPSDLRATPLNDMPAGRDTPRTTRPVPVPASILAPGEADRSGLARMLEAVLSELKVLREGQERILATIERSAGAAPLTSLGADIDDAPFRPEVRARRRKSVLLVDDDTVTRAAAVAALERAEVPVRTVTNGSAALSAIADDKPDIVVMELDMGGAMAGKDVINEIKATMEWVGVPILLYTRVPIASQKEARTTHGADEYVLKDAGPDALVSRVITLFRKH